MLRLSAAGESPGPRAAAPWPLAGESRVTESPARADSDPGLAAAAAAGRRAAFKLQQRLRHSLAG